MSEMIDQPEVEISEDDLVVLPEVEESPEDVDHPDAITDEEAEEGLVFYKDVDDLDDSSNGVTA